MDQKPDLETSMVEGEAPSECCKFKYTLSLENLEQQTMAAIGRFNLFQQMKCRNSKGVTVLTVVSWIDCTDIHTRFKRTY